MTLRKKFGDEWMLDNPPANFEVLQSYAQKMRFNCANIEYQIGNRLRSKGLPIEHQVIYFNRYIADLALPKARTIIEIDGLYHSHESQFKKDLNRDKVFNAFGFDVHRWPTNLSPISLQTKIDCFAKAYNRFSKGYKLKPLVRPPSIEKITTDGLIQKALMLKARKL